ncbi:MAG: hypothetical protein NTZ78_03355 [Candidatus Aureabacteria bacterium]|nr:hypothetical protein [Candidatus Auribacterota bacterium]
MKKLMTAVLGLICAAGLVGMVMAGSIDSPGIPSAGSGMYSLSQIYDYLNLGIEVTPVPNFQEPSTAPGSTMKTTKQIYEDIKVKFGQCAATTDNVEQGVTFFCTKGTWGVQTGTLAALPRPTATPTATPTVTPTPTPTVTPTFACGTAFTDPRDEKIYNTVLIGTQCWMARNLDHNTGCSSVTWVDNVDNGWCGYHGPDVSRGLIYQYSAAVTACPAGWHLPTHDESTTLERAVCTSGTCATDFPYDTTTTGERGTDESYALRTGGSSHFDALAAGYYHCDRQPGEQPGAYIRMRWVTSTVTGGTTWWRRQIYPAYGTIDRYNVPLCEASPVRCIKD